jgi:Zn-dependent protease
MFRFGIGADLSLASTDLFGRLILINVALGVFNFLPVAPLDGAKIFAGLLPDRIARAYEELMARGGFIMFLLVVVAAGRIVAVPIAWASTFLGIALRARAGAG